MKLEKSVRDPRSQLGNEQLKKSRLIRKSTQTCETETTKLRQGLAETFYQKPLKTGYQSPSQLGQDPEGQRVCSSLPSRLTCGLASGSSPMSCLTSTEGQTSKAHLAGSKWFEIQSNKALLPVLLLSAFAIGKRLALWVPCNQHMWNCLSPRVTALKYLQFVPSYRLWIICFFALQLSCFCYPVSVCPKHSI